jgi:hypothetical protein
MAPLTTGLEFEATTEEQRAANAVGWVYLSDLGGEFEVVAAHTIPGYIRVKQLGAGTFCGDVFRWHVSSLNAMRRVRFVQQES